MYAYATAIFLSAFLVFQVQPILARYILPWFGGTPAVWTACMLFFQGGLLLGYAYAHWLSKLKSTHKQAVVHLALLALSLIALPIIPAPVEHSNEQQQMVTILLLLTQAVGVQFVLLSASAPLIQHWFAQAHPNKQAFRLYALSNAGSLLALISYPFVVETTLSLGLQSNVWMLGYCVFFALLVIALKPLIMGWAKVPIEAKEVSLFAPRITTRLYWILLAALGSISLLAVTNLISQDVAVVPFLWVLPLSLYLLSFIICFDRDAWYVRWLWYPVLACAIVGLLYVLHAEYSNSVLPLTHQVIVYSVLLFALCMVCHGELVRSRPTTQYLTLFYLYVAFGGALGGLFVNLVAPFIFSGYFELNWVVVIVAFVAALVFLLDTKDLPILYLRIAFAFGLLGLLVLSALFVKYQFYLTASSLHTSRNFYGVVHVYQKSSYAGDQFRALYHGNIRHGTQYQAATLQTVPTSYFGDQSGVGFALNHHPKRLENRSLNIGVIGLGTGTIAAHGRKDDAIKFYEINPRIVSVANSFFTYLDQSEAQTAIHVGDGRSVLRQQIDNQLPQQFDVLAVDAFSADAIPVHLLTKEAFNLYWQHLNTDGILAIHITNRHLDLSDVVRQHAKQSGKEALLVRDIGGKYTDLNDWVLVTSNATFIQVLEQKDAISKWSTPAKSILWSDDFSNLFEVLKR